MLGDENFPIIFETVKGKCEQMTDDRSSFNRKEVQTVTGYVHKLLNGNWNGTELFLKDIGVVSPYKRQCELIRSDLRSNNFDGITVGTPEIFQGQERRVMILSTVRTDGHLGQFVRNEQVSSSIKTIVIFIIPMIFCLFIQRLNVMITRAICLVIIVGDHETLELDQNWHKIIEKCNSKGALRQSGKPLHPRIMAP